MEFLRCPAQFGEFYTEFLTPYLNCTFKEVEYLPYSFLFCFTTFGRFCIFSGIGSVIHILKKVQRADTQHVDYLLVHELHRVKKSSPSS